MEDIRGGFGGYAIHDQDWEVLGGFIKKHNIKKVVEFGSGRSTYLMDKAGVSVVSFETDLQFCKHLMTRLENALVVSWDGKEASIPLNADMIFIDGPKESEDRDNSYRIAAASRCKYIACHDYKRAGETKWREKWMSDWKPVEEGLLTAIYERVEKQAPKDYCDNHKDNDFCKYTRSDAPRGFCQVACKGKYEKFQMEDIEVDRARMRADNPVKDDGETVSVIIPYFEDDTQYLDQTVKSLKDNAIGKIEIMPMFDEFRQGQRFLTNKAAKVATGKYLLRLDCHTAMSPGWDVRMKASCGETTIVKPILDALDVNTWRGKNKDMGLVVLDKYLRNVYVHPWKPYRQREIEEDTMCMTGCCWMIQKQYYDKLGGCDESFGVWGVLGAEWSLKAWLTGGRVLIRTDTVCYHLFRERPFDIDLFVKSGAYQELRRLWLEGKSPDIKRDMIWLLKKFWSDIQRQSRINPALKVRKKEVGKVGSSA